MSQRPVLMARHVDRRLAMTIALVVLQIVIAIFFVADAIADIRSSTSGVPSVSNITELLVAVALMAGIVMGAWHSKMLFDDLRNHHHAIAIARGALGKFIALRFAEWRLSAAESDVALFALKGCNITEISQMRGAAPGTVRAQLSRIYAKADVTSQSMLVSLFIEDLLSDDAQLAA